jgi:P4 family phage/plasmid primase-like protien
MDNAIQIVGIREGRGTVFLGEGWRLENIEQVFSPIHRQELIQKVPEKERYNLYFTAAKCWEGAGRKLAEQDIIPFDIDKLHLPDTMSEEDMHAHAVRVARLVCDVVQVRYEDTGVIFSGNGVWVIIRTTKPWTDEEYFNKTRVYYDDITKRINQKLLENGISGIADTTGWAHGKLCRLPDTNNVKKDKQTRRAVVLNHSIRAIDWYIEEACPELKFFEEAESVSNVPFSNPDVDGIIKECEFLNARSTDHATESENEWYARAGLYAFFPHGKDQLFHEHSKQYHGYTQYETEFKLEQARAAQTGPRKCADIYKRTNGKFCIKCKHYQKVTTPFQIVSDTFIKAEATGFWVLNNKGAPTKPATEDLVRAFIKEHIYVSILGEKVIMKFNGTHWEEMDDQLIKAWANDKTNPKYSEAQREEFVKSLHIQTGRIKKREDFDLGAFGKLDMKTMQTSQHSPDNLFTYCLPYAYDPIATAPTFENFVTQVTSCQEDALTIKEFIGYAASGDEVTGKGRCLIIIGGGANGKGVLTRLISVIVGEQNASGKNMETLTTKSFTRHAIMYKLVNISSEATENVFKYTEYLKQMTNGDVVTAEKKHGPETDYKNRTKLIMTMNQIPKIYDDSNGFARRLLVIPFEKTFEGANEDPQLEYKLSQEVPGILNSCIRAYIQMKQRGEQTKTTLPFSSIVLTNERVRKIKDDEDYFKMFADERILILDEFQESSTTFYSAYLNFCNDVGLRKRLSPIQFGIRLKKHFNLGEPRLSNGKRFYTGIKLHEEF